MSSPGVSVKRKDRERAEVSGKPTAESRRKKRTNDGNKREKKEAEG